MSRLRLGVPGNAGWDVADSVRPQDVDDVPGSDDDRWRKREIQRSLKPA
jgi:hypothetical protein